MIQITPNIVNAVLFQVTWFAAVAGAAAGSVSPGLAAFGVLAVHVLATGHWRRDLGAAAVCVFLGGLLDTLWVQIGILDFGMRGAPGWILVLWAAVGLSLHASLSWFLQRPLLGGVLAACSAPLSYSAGASLGAATVVAPIGLLLVSVSWLLLFWALFLVYGAPRRPRVEFGI